MSLVRLNSEQSRQLGQTRAVIGESIRQAGGAIPFDRYMELALYAPGAGYYVNGARKFGRQGDFVTAPETSSLFSRCLANQCAEVLAQTGGDILEFGAGSGIMAADILARLQELDSLPGRYQIMELSAELRQRQRETLAARVPDLLARVEWLDRLPGAGWRGMVLGNELLDAMPVSRFRREADGWAESFIEGDVEAFRESWRPPAPGLERALGALEGRLGAFEAGYTSEINLRLGAWMRAVTAFLGRGAILLIDYGYPERAYYHPERDQGTLICHFQHRAHDDFLLLPGLQDLTANVDFSALAQAGVEAGLELGGYTTQAQFLLGCGLDALLSDIGVAQGERYLREVQAAKQLILPGAMGERFQVMAFTCGIDPSLRGFSSRDMRETL